MKTLLVVYHSMTGGSEQMARALVAGAATETGTKARLLHASTAHATDVINSDAYVFVTPENLAAISGLMKDFFDRCYYPALDRISGRPYAALICAGSDGQNAARQIERIATGWRLRAVAEPIIVCTHAQTPAEILAQKTIPAAALQRCAELGATLASGLALGVF